MCVFSVLVLCLVGGKGGVWGYLVWWCRGLWCLGVVLGSAVGFLIGFAFFPYMVFKQMLVSAGRENSPI